MASRDRPQALGHEPPARVSPDASRSGDEPLPDRGGRRKRRTQRLERELVRVEVENRELPKPAGDRPGREDPPVASPSDWERPARRDRELPELAPALQLQSVRRVGDAAEPVGDPRRVVLARVTTKPELGEDVVGPRRRARDRERRCAVGDRPTSGRRLDRHDAPLDVVAKLVRRLFRYARVRVAVRGGVVSARDDLAHEVAVVRDGHAEHEERRPRAELVEQVEKTTHVRPKLGVRTVPVREAEAPVDELVPVLEVDAQQETRPRVHGRTLLAQSPQTEPSVEEFAITSLPLPPFFARYSAWSATTSSWLVVDAWDG